MGMLHHVGCPKVTIILAHRRPVNTSVTVCRQHRER
jgi:hypothetical protein